MANVLWSAESRADLLQKTGESKWTATSNMLRKQNNATKKVPISLQSPSDDNTENFPA